MSMKKILMLSVMTALISPITVSSAIASTIEEQKQAVATANAELAKKINVIIGRLNKILGTKLALAKASDITSLENAVDEIRMQLSPVYQLGVGDTNKQNAQNFNDYLKNIIPNHKFDTVKNDSSNFVAVMTASKQWIGLIPESVFTGVEVTGSGSMSLAQYVEGMRKTLVDMAAHGPQNKAAVNAALGHYHLEIK